MNYSVKERKPLILITNDDGIRSPGLLAAAEAAASFGELLIIAPHTQQTAMGRSYPVTPDAGIIEEVVLDTDGKGRKAYAVHGSPAMAVAHGILEISDRKPDLCISGINYGENLGSILTCSGTLGAAFEANGYGIPGIAVSMYVEFGKHTSNDFDPDVDWKPAQEILREYMGKVLAEGMPHGVDVWNINVPGHMRPPYESRFTRQSRQSYYCFTEQPKRDLSRPYRLKSKYHIDMDTLEEDSDIYAVHVENKISVTPLCLDMSVEL